MDRRWTGIVVLVAAVAAAVVVGSLRTKPVPGSAAAAPPPAPPAVGDCLGEFTGSSYPFEAASVPCSEPHFGEVTLVMPHGLDSATSTETPFDDATDEINACTAAGQHYLGAPDPLDAAEGQTPAWQPVAALTPDQIQPSELARARGSTWLLCAISVAGADLGLNPYEGTVRDGFRTGTLPSTLASCPLSLEQLSSYQDCLAPHDVEVFGTFQSERPVAAPDATKKSCRELITKSTGLVDPTAGGRLAVEVVVENESTTSVSMPNTSGDAGSTGEPPVSVDPGSTTTYEITSSPLYVYTCVVRAAGGRTLTGPLLDLHGGPLPLK